MQLKQLVIMMFGAVAAFSEASVVCAATLVPMDEPATQLVSPSASIQAVQYNFGGPPAISLVTATPLLCADTAAPTSNPAATISTTYYSANGSAGASPLPFVFGASSATPGTSAIASGPTLIGYDGSTVQFSGDALDALVCYGLDANGVHAVTRHLFDGDFEPVTFDSTVSLSVFHVPASSTDYYGYTVDVTIPPLPAGTNCSANGLDCQFALVEGYDTSVFSTASGQWCLAPAGAQGCAVPAPSGGTAPAYGDININYVNYASTVSLLAPISPAPAKQYHFVVIRYLKSGVSALPASGAPVAMAALFSPADLGENKLDDNVATGNNTLANVAPSVTQDAAYNTFVSALATLHESTDSGALTFDISDPDTIESSGNLLSTAVTLNLPNGIQVPVTANCGSTTPITTLPVNRTCTIDIPLNDGTFWDSFVTTAYRGQFNNVATDITNGAYATGVAASAQIVVTDSVGKASAPVSLAVHVYSTKNDAPLMAFGPAMPMAADGNTSYPTWACSLAANTCGTSGGRYLINLPAVITAQPGPVAAFDELAAQTTSVVNYVQATVDQPPANGGNVLCINEQGAVFATNGNPIVAPSIGSQTTYDNSFQLTYPPTVGSALCTVTITDAEASFPNSETATTTQATFRIVVGQ